MRIYLARHGESEANVMQVISNRGFVHPLTGKGRQQAKALARELAEVPVTRIYTSPIMRSVQTAQILSEMWDVPCEVADALRERDAGILEGKSDEVSWQQHHEIFKAWYERHDWTYCAEGGESFQDLRIRFVPFVEGLVQAHGGGPETFVFVGHAGTYRAMLHLILENIDFDFSAKPKHIMDNTTYVLAEVRDDKLFCLEWRRFDPQGNPPQILFSDTIHP